MIKICGRLTHPQPYLFKTLHLGVREAEDLFGVVLDDGGGHSPRRGVELGGEVFSQNFILESIFLNGRVSSQVPVDLCCERSKCH